MIGANGDARFRLNGHGQSVVVPVVVDVVGPVVVVVVGPRVVVVVVVVVGGAGVVVIVYPPIAPIDTLPRQSAPSLYAAAMELAPSLTMELRPYAPYAVPSSWLPSPKDISMSVSDAILVRPPPQSSCHTTAAIASSKATTLADSTVSVVKSSDTPMVRLVPSADTAVSVLSWTITKEGGGGVVVGAAVVVGPADVVGGGVVVGGTVVVVVGNGMIGSLMNVAQPSMLALMCVAPVRSAPSRIQVVSKVSPPTTETPVG